MKTSVKKKYDFLTSFIKNYKLEKDDTNLSIWCPYCKNPNKNKFKLVIHLEKNFYHCWVCGSGKGKSIISLIKKLDSSKVSLAKSLFYSKKNSFNLFEEKEEILQEEVHLPEDFKLLSNNFNSKSKDVKDIFKYCIKRGFNKHKMQMLKVGYSNLFGFKRSLIIPSFDDTGEVNFYTSRRIDMSSSDPYKYNNARIQKKNIVFNDLNIDWSIPLTIVEGPLDLIKANDNSTCILGSSLTEDMLLFQKIVKNKTNVFLALDSDAYSKTIRIAKNLKKYDIDVRIVDTRNYDDVGDMSIEYFENKLKSADTFNEYDLLLNKIKLL